MSNAIFPIDIEKYIVAEKPAKVRHITEAVADFVRTLETRPEKITGHPTKYWTLFNRCFGGARAELVTITAETGSGKSTFARNWIQDMVHQGIPSCLISLEESMNAVMHRLSQMETGIASHKLDKGTKEWFGNKLEKLPLYYLDHAGIIHEDLVLKTIEYAASVHSVEFFVIDHLDYITKKTSWSNNESYVVGDFLRRLATLSHTLNVTIVLIVHPRGLDIRGNKRREIGIDELKGTSSIKQESDAVFSIFREVDGSNKCFLRFLKIRSHTFSKYLNAKIQYTFDEPNLRFEENENAGVSYD